MISSTLSFRLSGFLLHALLATGVWLTVSFAAPKPNILLIVADDCTYNDLALYGGETARTPHIDALAAKGLTFDRAYLAEAMCQPCRAELYTGQYPLRNGCAWNHSASHPATRSLPQWLKPLGYRVGLTGKKHVKPDAAFPFETVPGFDSSCVRNPTSEHDLAPTRAFMEQADSPFCLVVGLVEPHVPWVMGDASAYPPKRIKLPLNIADTPQTRNDFSAYLAEITYMDGQVGQLLEALRKSGKADTTLVLFTSEQGAQFPGCKWTNWNTGVHTALVAQWPGVTKPGTRTKALVQYADVLPTLLEAATGEEPVDTSLDGRSFLSVLTGEHDSHREYVYGLHNNLPEGPAYPIRSITDGTYHYLENLLPENLYIEKHLMGGGRLNNPYWATWVASSSTNQRTYELVMRFQRRPAAELYHSENDPYEMTNLADDPAQSERLTRLREELHRWMAEQGDPGAAQDTMDALSAARNGTHLYGPLRK